MPKLIKQKKQQQQQQEAVFDQMMDLNVEKLSMNENLDMMLERSEQLDDGLSQKSSKLSTASVQQNKMSKAASKKGSLFGSLVNSVKDKFKRSDKGPRKSMKRSKAGIENQRTFESAEYFDSAEPEQFNMEVSRNLKESDSAIESNFQEKLMLNDQFESKAESLNKFTQDFKQMEDDDSSEEDISDFQQKIRPNLAKKASFDVYKESLGARKASFGAQNNLQNMTMQISNANMAMRKGSSEDDDDQSEDDDIEYSGIDVALAFKPVKDASLVDQVEDASLNDQVEDAMDAMDVMGIKDQMDDMAELGMAKQEMKRQKPDRKIQKLQEPVVDDLPNDEQEKQIDEMIQMKKDDQQLLDDEPVQQLQQVQNEKSVEEPKKVVEIKLQQYEQNQQVEDEQLKQLIAIKGSLLNDSMYQSLLEKCTTMGCWDADALPLINQFLIKSYQERLAQMLKDNSDFRQLMLTVLALQILAVHFAEKKAQWKMIMNKAKKYLSTVRSSNQDKKDQIAQLEKDVKNMVLDFEIDA